MKRLARKIALQAEIETTYGGGLPGGMGWADALQILPRTRPRHRHDYSMNEPRDLYTPWLGASDVIPGPATQELEFEVELAGSGTPATPPPWGKLLRGCQFAQAIFSSGTPRVEYTPVSEPGESLVTRTWEDGSAAISRGNRGRVRFDVQAFRIPRATFGFRGFDTNRVSAGAAQPASPYAAWKTPILPTTATAGSVLLGCSYATGSLSGGTAYPAKGFTLDLGHRLEYDAILDGEEVVVVERNPTGELILELTPAQEAAWWADMRASVETTFGWQIGTAAGNRILFFARRFQRQEVQAFEENGFRRLRVKFGLILDKDDPNDDFMRIVTR